MTQLTLIDPPKAPKFNDQFGEFYTAYPRKVAPLKARVAYKKALTLASHADIMEGLERYKKTKPDYCDWSHPTSWLNAGRWMDEPDAGITSTAPKTDQQLSVIAGHVRRDWYQIGRYSRDVLEQCVAAGALTRDELEGKW